jgi:hypothetical protein
MFSSHSHEFSLFPCPQNMFPKGAERHGMIPCKSRESDNNAWPRTMWMGYDDLSWDCNPRTRLPNLFPKGAERHGMIACKSRESDNNAWLRTMWMGYGDSSWDCNPRTRFRVLVNGGDPLRGANILGQVGA